MCKHERALFILPAHAVRALHCGEGAANGVAANGTAACGTSNQPGGSAAPGTTSQPEGGAAAAGGAGGGAAAAAAAAAAVPAGALQVEAELTLAGIVQVRM